MIDHRPVPPDDDRAWRSDATPAADRKESAPKPASDSPAPSTYASAGLQFALAIILFLFLGQWLDNRFGTTPIFVIAGVFIGAGAAFFNMYRKLMAQHQDAGKKR